MWQFPPLQPLTQTVSHTDILADKMSLWEKCLLRLLCGGQRIALAVCPSLPVVWNRCLGISWGASLSFPPCFHGSFVCLQLWLTCLHFPPCRGVCVFCVFWRSELVSSGLHASVFWSAAQEEERLRVFPCLSVVLCRRVLFHCLQNSIFYFLLTVSWFAFLYFWGDISSGVRCKFCLLCFCMWVCSCSNVVLLRCSLFSVGMLCPAADGVCGCVNSHVLAPHSLPGSVFAFLSCSGICLPVSPHPAWELHIDRLGNFPFLFRLAE